MRKLMLLVLALLAMSSPALAQDLFDEPEAPQVQQSQPQPSYDPEAIERKCIKEQILFLERERAAENMSFDEIAKTSLSNCSHPWKENFYHPSYDYALNNPEFLALDNKMRKKIEKEKARQAQVEAKRKEAEEKTMRECGESLAAAKLSAPDEIGLDRHELALAIAGECAALPGAMTPARLIENDEAYPAYDAAYYYQPPVQKGTQQAEAAWRKDNAPKAKQDAPVQETKITWGGIAYVVIFWGLIFLAAVERLLPKRKPPTPKFVDLSANEWSKARIEPVFDVKPYREWDNEKHW